jgi:hypothetical protein
MEGLLLAVTDSVPEKLSPVDAIGFTSAEQFPPAEMVEEPETQVPPASNEKFEVFESASPIDADV